MRFSNWLENQTKPATPPSPSKQVTNPAGTRAYSNHNNLEPRRNGSGKQSPQMVELAAELKNGKAMVRQIKGKIEQDLQGIKTLLEDARMKMYQLGPTEMQPANTNAFEQNLKAAWNAIKEISNQIVNIHDNIGRAHIIISNDESHWQPSMEEEP
jgi:hypothetical protein